MGTTLWGTWYALRKLKRPIPDSIVGLPPVSILKPLKGWEPGMEENIVSFFRLDYPMFEIIFSVADRRDPAVAVVSRMISDHPGVVARLHIGELDVGPNPKINNLIYPYREASYDHLLISDSNVRVSSDYLRRVVAHLTPSVGVVTAVVAGTRGGGLGGKLEAAYLNSFYARWMHIAEALGQSFVVGKSMLFRRSVAERFGGIENLAHYIAEDYMAGQAMRRLGLQVVIMRDPIHQHIGAYEFRSFWSRHLRWGRIRKAQAPFAFIAEPLLFSLVSGLFGAWAFHAWLGISPFWFLVAHLGVWGVSDLLLIKRLEDRLRLDTVLFWLLREILALPLWCHMACGSSINWRGNRLRILPGGLVVQSS